MFCDRQSRSRGWLAGVLAVLAITAVGCGGATRVDTSSSATSGSGGAAAPEVTTTTGALGTYLVDGTGRSLYMYDADPEGGSECYDDCATAWPPLPSATAGSGVTAKDLTSSTRTDGVDQAVYDQHALYYYSKDTAPGQTTGQGFVLTGGGIFYLLGPDGTPIKTGVTASGSSPATASSSG